MDRREASKILVGTLGAAPLAASASGNSFTGAGHPPTAAERAASVTPTDLSHLPGNVRRYGATGDGITDDRPAFVAAFRANNYVFVPTPPVEYLVSAEIAVDRSDITLMGETKRLCRIRLAATAGAEAAVLRWNVPAINVHIERIGLALKNAGMAQRGLRFAGLRSSRVIDCWIEGPGTADDDTTAIQFDGPDTSRDEVVVERCHITNHKIGIDVRGTRTMARIVNCELYGTHGASATTGIRVANASLGTLISGCTFDQWGRGIYSEGGAVRQVGNYVEGSFSHWA